LLRLYFARYITGENANGGLDTDTLSRGPLAFLRPAQPPPSIAVAPDVTEELLAHAAARTSGFSGRELAKLMSAVQAAVYGRPPPRVLTAAILNQVVDYKVQEHVHKKAFASGSVV